MMKNKIGEEGRNSSKKIERRLSDGDVGVISCYPSHSFPSSGLSSLSLTLFLFISSPPDLPNLHVSHQLHHRAWRKFKSASSSLLLPPSFIFLLFPYSSPFCLSQSWPLIIPPFIFLLLFIIIVIIMKNMFNAPPILRICIGSIFGLFCSNWIAEEQTKQQFRQLHLWQEVARVLVHVFVSSLSLTPCSQGSSVG